MTQQAKIILQIIFSLLAFVVLPSHAQTDKTKPLRISLVLPEQSSLIDTSFKESIGRRGMQIQYSSHIFPDQENQRKALILQLQNSKPDLIYVRGTQALLSIAGRYDETRNESYIRDIPIIFAIVSDPLALKILPSSRNHDRNLTGLSYSVPLTMQISTINAYRPLKRLAYLLNPNSNNSKAMQKMLLQQAQTNGFTLVSENISFNEKTKQIDQQALLASMAQLKKHGVEFIYFGPDKTMVEQAELFLKTAQQAKLASFCSAEWSHYHSQCVLSVALREENIGRLLADKAIQILNRKIAPGRIASDNITPFKTQISMPAAKALSFYPPLSLLNIAEVINVKNSINDSSPNTGNEHHAKQ